MSELRKAATAPDDGWLRLWEAIYERPWPLRDRQALEAFAAWQDWHHDQAEMLGLGYFRTGGSGSRGRYTA